MALRKKDRTFKSKTLFIDFEFAHGTRCEITIVDATGHLVLETFIDHGVLWERMWKETCGPSWAAERTLLKFYGPFAKPRPTTPVTELADWL